MRSGDDDDRSFPLLRPPRALSLYDRSKERIACEWFPALFSAEVRMGRMVTCLEKNAGKYGGRGGCLRENPWHFFRTLIIALK